MGCGSSMVSLMIVLGLRFTRRRTTVYESTSWQLAYGRLAVSAAINEQGLIIVLIPQAGLVGGKEQYLLFAVRILASYSSVRR
jgi:hypothetical protein